LRFWTTGSIYLRELAERVNRFGSGLQAMGLAMEHRVLLALTDTIDFPTAFLGAIKSGIIPVAVNTLLTSRDYEYMLCDSRARRSSSRSSCFRSLLRSCQPAVPETRDRFWHSCIRPRSVRGGSREGSLELAPAPTTCDDPCFWLYSSGSTARRRPPCTCIRAWPSPRICTGKGVLGVTEKDVLFSAAKLVFAYGLGNAQTFALATGATAVLMAERATPTSVFKRLAETKPSIFYAVPTLYGAMLASPEFPKRNSRAARLRIGGRGLAGRPGRRWKERTGVDILEGIGSTEMLHMFISARPGDVRYGATGKPVPGYELRLVDERGLR